jgi:beta-lactamase regulating signal transducer with metallopeptidase domain
MNIASLLASGGQSLNVPLVLLLIKATTILLAALGITLAMQRASAGARHLVWLVTLGALLLIPALTAWGPLRLEVLPAAEQAAVTALPTIPAPPVTAPAPVADGSASIVASAGSTSPAAASDAPSVSAADTGIIASIRDARLWVVALTLWAVVALAIVVSLTWSALVVRRLVRRSEPLDDQSWLTPLYEVSDRLGLDEPPRLLMSRDAKMPFACGLATPTIVLPAECENWSHERRLAVLLHELAHVRRHDCAVWMVAQVAVALFWFHPGVWWAAARLLAARELACDERVVRAGVQRADYAECLMRVADRARAHGAWSSVAVAAGMARPSRLKDRLHAVLTAAPRSRALDRAASLAVAVCAAATVALLGSARLAPTPAAVALAIRSPDPSVQAYARFYAMRYRCMDAPETCRKRTSTATVKQ